MGQAHALRTSNITIDGDLQEWQKANSTIISTPDQVLSGRDAWKDPSDLSVAAEFAWDEQYLYLAITVNDDVLERNSPINQAYKSDCMEFFIGTPNNENRQIFLAPAMSTGTYNQAQAWCQQTKSNTQIKIQSRMTNDGYIMEAAIPWQTVFADFQPTKGIQLRMSYQVCDSDRPNEPAAKTIVWQGSAGNWLKPEKWGSLILQ